MKRFLLVLGAACAVSLFAASSRIQSDWFSGNTITPVFWSTSLLRGGTAVQNGNELALTAPASANHDNTAGWVQLTQTIPNGDFAIITKMDSKPPNQSGGTWYGPGIEFLQDTNNGVYCEYVWSGFVSSYLFSCSKAVSGTQTSMTASRGASGDPGPYYLEVIRSGDNWTLKYSLDGSSWTTLWTFTQAFTINQMALFANNYNSTPGNAQAFTGTFDYVCNAINDRCITRNITRMFWFPTIGSSGGGQPIVPLVTISPEAVNFGSQQVGTTSGAQSITLTNNSNAPIPISSIAITGTNASSFSQTNNCGSSLASLANCTISAKFSPTTNGTLTASLQATTTPSVPAVSLSGVGTSIPTQVCNPPRITVTGNNNSGDYNLLQNALNGGGNIAINGTFAIGTNQLNFPSNSCTSSTSGAVINYTGSDYAGFLAASGSNITINGITFNGGGLYMHRTGNNNPATNITLSNNTIKNITSGKHGFMTEAVMRNTIISGNTFLNIGNGGWGPPPNGGNPARLGANFCPGPACGDYDGNAIRALSGWDNSQIVHNHFNEVLNDAIASDMDLCIAVGSAYTSCANNVIGYNDFQNIYRMGTEWQTVTGSCPGGCDFSKVSVIHNNSVIGNAYHNIARGYYQTYYQSNVPGKNSSYLNNTCLMDNTGFGSTAADCFEVSNEPGTVLVQGNVTGTATTMSKSFQHAYITSTPGTGTTQLLQNNTHCGPIMAFQATEPGGSGGTLTVANNFNNYPSGCPWNATTPFVSAITPAWSSGNPTNFPSGGNGLWNMTVLSNLSIIEVDFFVDSTSGLPVVTQTISDVSTTFASDRKWKYHATINTSAYSNGNHTLYAVARDVSGATQTISTTFHVGP